MGKNYVKNEVIADHVSALIELIWWEAVKIVAKTKPNFSTLSILYMFHSSASVLGHNY